MKIIYIIYKKIVIKIHQYYKNWKIFIITLRLILLFIELI